MKPEQKEEELLESEAESDPEEEELELEVWDNAADDEESGGLTVNDEIGGYNEGLEDKLDKFSPEY